MLAIVYGLDKFHQYFYGREVIVVTDHQPLVSIKNKPLAKAPKRLRAMLLKTQDYNNKLTYKPGTKIPVADALSRIPLNDREEVSFIELEQDNLPFSEENFNNIKGATASDAR